MTLIFLDPSLHETFLFYREGPKPLWDVRGGGAPTNYAKTLGRDGVERNRHGPSSISKWRRVRQRSRDLNFPMAVTRLRGVITGEDRGCYGVSVGPTVTVFSSLSNFPFFLTIKLKRISPLSILRIRFFLVFS